jgi:hypothetical protein
MCFWKIDRVLRFFPSGGLYRRRGDGGAVMMMPESLIAFVDEAK